MIIIFINVGTPGVGKSTISRIVAEKAHFTWREVSKLAEERQCLEEYDPVYQCPLLNEDKVKLNHNHHLLPNFTKR